MRRLAACVFALLSLTALCRAAEIDEVYRNAWEDFREGRYERAASGFRYLETIGSVDSRHVANLALALRAEDHPDQELAYWIKATLLSPQDPFLWNQRGWTYLSLGQEKDARDSFRKALSISSSAASSAEADLGLGLSSSISGDLQAAYAPLQSCLSLSPYMASAASVELGRLTLRRRHYPQSIPFFTMALAQDPLQSDAAKDLAFAYEKTGQGQAAWQAYKLALDLDPADKAASSRKDKIASYLERRPVEAMPLRRMARPLMREPLESDMPAARSSAQSAPLRVRMFSDNRGMPAHLTRFFVMGSSELRLLDIKIGTEVERLKAMTQWSIVYRADNRVIEVRDASNNLRFVTRQSFRLERTQPWGTVLVKNPELTQLIGIDPGDRELRGSIEIIPTPMGFHLVNELPMEQYLQSVLGRILPENSPLEAYKAVAVLMRSRVSSILSKPVEDAERTNLCDSEACIPYEGLAAESAASSQAVYETRGIALTPSAGPAAVEYHLSCGGRTEGGILDRATPALELRSALDLEHSLHDFPEDGGYDEASAHVPAVWNRWVRVFDAEALRENAERLRPIGPVQDVRVLRRGPTGRALSLEVVGARGRLVFEGDRRIESLLSPGSLRSMLFSLQPIYDGRKLSRLIVWGAGTGHGRGLCVAGAVGQSHLGRKFNEILLHYFPDARLIGMPALPKEPAKAALPRTPRRRAAAPQRTAPPTVAAASTSTIQDAAADEPDKTAAATPAPGASSPQSFAPASTSTWKQNAPRKKRHRRR
ncbi:MAG: SpoIID/LytB domain-containing protein [Elusimicrobiota bacterium]|jgi:stage II sporulation protein D